MELYIVKSGVCLAIFYGFYKLLLEKASFHNVKRFYLLVALVLAFGIPFITFTEYVEPVPMAPMQEFNFNEVQIPIIDEAPKTNYLPIIIWSVYGIGVLVFAFMFFKNLLGLVNKIKRNPKLKSKSFINVLLNDLVIPHTFFSYIFLNKHKFETQQIPKEVLLHEETHAKEKHSLDILLIELLQIFFWFNPFIYLIKHSIKLNHEFLADRAVLKQGIASSTYQNMLLAFSSNASEPQLANAINYSSIKKRFTVMKTHTTKKALWLRSLILLPLLAVLIYSFCEKKVVEKPQVFQITDSLMKEYKAFINNVETTNVINYPKYQRAVAIYDLMTDEQRNSVKKYPENPLANLTEVKLKTPSETEFNSWKDANKFAIWIDGTPVKNSELNNYKVSDIKYFTSSFVYNNARSDRFPQPYQNHLYTEKGYKALVAERKDMINGFLSTTIEIKRELQRDKASKEIKIHINKDKKVTIGNETIDFNSLSDKLIEMTRDKVIKPSVNIEIDGHLDSSYLVDITNEVKKSKLGISQIGANAIFLDENGKIGSDYFKGILTAKTIHLKNKNGELVKGTSGQQIIRDTLKTSRINEDYDLITIKLPKDRGRNLNSNDLEKLDEFVKETFYKQNNQQKAQTVNDINIWVNGKENLLVNKSIVEINDLKRFLDDLTKGLTKKEKEEFIVNLVNNEAPDDVLNRVKSILRESHLLKINVIVVTETQQKIIELPFSLSSIRNKETPEQKKAIDSYVKKNPEAKTKVKSESGEIIEIVEIPTDSIPESSAKK